MLHLLRSFEQTLVQLADIVSTTEKAAAECISDDALIHLKSYKYSSVDKSPVSKYILGPWVRLRPFFFLWCWPPTATFDEAYAVLRGAAA